MPQKGIASIPVPEQARKTVERRAFASKGMVINMSNLIIVESPKKVETIKRYLKGDYEVIASMGHLRDLPKSKIGVDIEHDFKPEYCDIKGKEKTISEIKKKAKKADNVYLAADPDREGEAISWHLANILNLNLNDNNRITFNEITKSGIEAGIKAPRTIDINKVNAQQARRILDRIVGYKLSPFLWKKVRRGLSAGRVQSAAVRMIVDRENEIKSFVSQEYWSIDAKLCPEGSRKSFDASLSTVDGKKFEADNHVPVDELVKRLKSADFVVTNIKKSVRKKTPQAPFTTSTLQQDASKRLGFQTTRTMRTAQELYEGVDIKGQGLVGLITYMRTDSLRISDEARASAHKFIEEKFGKDYIPEQPKKFKTRGNAQDAHEAIRPTIPSLTPDMVKQSGVTNDQYKLYKLIWERFIASQMENCLLNTVTVDIDADGCTFKASGHTIKFDGFTVIYDDTSKDDAKKILPEMAKGDKLNIKSLEGNQHFTQPPARYTEGTLVKAFEENGIGRPSTYASTIKTILDRNYVEREGKQIKPTILGEVITNLMLEHFNRIVDLKFTARMEDDLDDVEEGKKEWTKTLGLFYKDFDESLSTAEELMEGKRVKIPDEQTDQLCEKCGKPMVIKIGKFGKFLACSGFPDCTNTKKIVIETDGLCPYCGKKVLEKKSKRGKKYFGCEDNPNCEFMTWDTPTAEKCPDCGSTLFQKGGKKGKLICHKPDCGYEKDLSNE